MQHGPDPSSRPTPSTASRPAAPPGTVQVTGASVLGASARSVAVRVIANGGGLPSVAFKGLGETHAQPTRDRLRAAIANAGHPWPDTRITIILSPTDLPKRAGMLDLPIALGLLALGGVFPLASLEGLWAVGELGLDGALRPTPGVLPATVAACDAGARTILVPAASLTEAVHTPHGTSVLGADSLAAAADWLAGTPSSPLRIPNRQPYTPAPTPGPDLAETTADPRVRRALEIAAAGGHPFRLVGDGTGVSALARCLPGLLPDLTYTEALEVARIRSAAGIPDAHPHPRITRPFRAPHHEMTPEAFTGGGRDLHPGELSLAHHGVLFLDRPHRYPLELLGALHKPLEHGWVQVRHWRHTLRLPARFLLVTATTPDAGSSAPPPEPLAARTDLTVQVPRRAPGGSRESSAVVRGRVAAARGRQLDRGQTLNAHLPVKMLLAAFPRASRAWRTAVDTLDATPGLTIATCTACCAWPSPLPTSTAAEASTTSTSPRRPASCPAPPAATTASGRVTTTSPNKQQQTVKKGVRNGQHPSRTLRIRKPRFPMHQKDSTGPLALSELVGQAAAQVAGVIIAAAHAGHVPPASVVTAEQHLWRWSYQLRHTPANVSDRRGVTDPTPDVPRRVAVVLLVDVTVKRDLGWLSRDLLDTSGPAGQGWQVIHASVHPDPARLLAYLTSRDPQPESTRPHRRRAH